MNFQIGDEIEIIGNIQGLTGSVGTILEISEKNESFTVITDALPNQPIWVTRKEIIFYSRLINRADFCKYPHMAANARNKNATNISCRKSQELDASRYFEFVRR